MPKNLDVISQESHDFLEQVKKGKPRKFVMVCKGNQIVSLVLYKKGSVEKYKKEAKQTGKGVVMFGVIDGKGPDINFKLARADGFEKQPVKSVTLKKFLVDNTDFKFKPIFEIVDAPQLVLDDEDPLVLRFLALQERAMAAMESPNAAAIGQLCQEIGGLFDADQGDQASGKLDQLEKLLKESDGQEASDTPKTQDEPDLAAQQKSFVSRLRDLKPQATEAIEANVSISAEVKTMLAESAEFARQKDFDSALPTLDKLEKLLTNTRWRVELESKPSTASSETGSRSIEEIKTMLEPRLKPIWDKSTLKQVETIAKLDKAFQARKGEHYEAASKAVAKVMNRLEKLPSDLEQIGDLKTFLSNDPAVSILDESIKIKDPLLKVLSGFEDAFQRAATSK